MLTQSPELLKPLSINGMAASAFGIWASAYGMAIAVYGI
jgi:hypothetical protein